MKMGYYRSAAYYFDIVLNKYHDTYYAEPALLKKAEALYNRKMYSEADETVRLFIEKYASSSRLKDALSLQSKIKAGIAAELEESKKPKKTEHASEQLQKKDSSQ